MGAGLRISDPTCGFNFTQANRETVRALMASQDTDVSKESCQPNKEAYIKLLRDIMTRNTMGGTSYDDPQAPTDDCQRSILVDKRENAELSEMLDHLREMEGQIMERWGGGGRERTDEEKDELVVQTENDLRLYSCLVTDDQKINFLLKSNGSFKGWLVRKLDVDDVPDEIKVGWQAARFKMSENKGEKFTNNNLMFYPLYANYFIQKYGPAEIAAAHAYVISRTSRASRNGPVHPTFINMVEDSNLPASGANINPLTFPAWRMSRKKLSKILAYARCSTGSTYAFTMDHVFLSSTPMGGLRVLDDIYLTEKDDLDVGEVFSISQEMYSLMGPRRSINNFSNIGVKDQVLVDTMPDSGHMYDISNGKSKMCRARGTNKQEKKNKDKKSQGGSGSKKTPGVDVISVFGDGSA